MNWLKENSFEIVLCVIVVGCLCWFAFDKDVEEDRIQLQFEFNASLSGKESDP